MKFNSNISGSLVIYILILLVISILILIFYSTSLKSLTNNSIISSTKQCNKEHKISKKNHGLNPGPPLACPENIGSPGGNKIY